MTYNMKMRERCLRDILVDMKSRLDSENDFGLEVGYDKYEDWKGDEFKFNFWIWKPECDMTSEQYDKYVQLKIFANEMFNYLLNHNTIDISVSEDDIGCEFEFVSKVNK